MFNVNACPRAQKLAADFHEAYPSGRKPVVTPKPAHVEIKDIDKYQCPISQAMRLKILRSNS